MPHEIPTAHHQQQDDQQRDHEHQQGQPDVVPHLGERTAVGAGLRGGERGRAGGACWASAAAGGGEVPGRHGRRTPLGSAPRGRGGAARGREPRPARPADPPSLAGPRLYPLIARGSRGRGVRRHRRPPDVLPWRTPRARGRERGRARGRAAATRPSLSPARRVV